MFNKFSTKRDVDKHVRANMVKIRNDNERNQKGHTIAKLYVNVGEYRDALHYVSSYLLFRDDSAQAHKLQGLCYEKLNKIDQALSAYQRSLELDAKQTDLIVNVCKILLNDELKISPEKLQFFSELAKSQHVQHEAVLSLKLKLLSKHNGNPKPTEELLLTNIQQRPMDVTLRIHMVKHLLDQNRTADAFNYVYELEQRHIELFSQSINWYNCIALVVGKLKIQKQSDWTYWLLAIKTIEKQLALNLAMNSSYAQTSNLNDCTSLLFEFDQLLDEANKIASALFPERELAIEFLHHYKGQLCLHAATLLFKREHSQKNDWREVMKNALPLLLLAYNCGIINLEDRWCKNSIESIKQILRLWNQEGAFRCVQAGRSLLSCIDYSKDNNITSNIRKICVEKGIWTTNEELLAQIRQFCSNNEWRKNLFRTLFTSNQHSIKQDTSFLVQCAQLNEPVYQLPNPCELESYEECAQNLYPSSLHHMVYCRVWANDIAQLKCTVFNRLNFSTSNLTNCNAETMNQLDIDAFLYSATLRAKQIFDKERNDYESINGAYVAKPRALPLANVFKSLAADSQSDWWISAYKTYKNISSGDDLGHVRIELKYGIQTLRGINCSTVDVGTCLRVARIFANRAQESNKSVEKGYLEARAEALYKISLHLIKIEKLLETGAFKNDKELSALAEEAVSFIASRFFKLDEYEECIEELTNIQLPFAAYYIAEAYRKLYETIKTPKKNKRVYLEKAKECLQQTLSLLEYPYVDKNHALKSIVKDDLNNVQQQLNQSDNGNHLSDDNLNDSNALNTSLLQQRRDDVSNQSIVELKHLMNRMMETLSIVQEDVSGLKTKLYTIEENLNKKPESNFAEPQLDDYFIIDDELQNQGYNSSVYPSYNQQRMNQSTQMLNANQHQQAASNSSMNPYSNNMFLNNVYQQMAMNPYQSSLMMQQQRSGILPPPPAPLPYADPSLAYNMAALDPRNSILGLLTQTPQQLPPPPITTQIPLQQSATPLHQPSTTSLFQQQQPIGQLSSPQLNQSQLSTVAAAPQAAAAVVDKTFQTPNLLKTWNSSFNNAPVEKGPPVNVVITNSDPLPSHTTVTSQQTLSVTIPSYHIKNNVVPNDPQPPSMPMFGGLAALSQTQASSPIAAAVPTVIPTAKPFEIIKPTNSENVVVSKHSNENKPQFGGLSFSSTPKITTAPSTVAASSAEEKPKPPNPFANFTFGCTDKPNIIANPEKPKLDGIFSGLSTSLNLSGAFEKPANSSMGNKVEENTTTTASPSKDANDDDDYVPTAQFAPVIALPDLVEVKTGEEDEFTKFEHRAKLLRFVKETKEWKERGIGDMKILINKNDPNKVRLLMRRDQVFKLCCNQLLNKDTKFTMLPNIQTAMSWYGHDYSENEVQIELLAIRFKNSDVCKQFHDAILDAQKNMNTDSVTVTADQKQSGKDSNTNETNSFKPAADGGAIGFGDQFKPKVGAWECSVCYISNGGDSLKCLACETPKDSTVATASGFGDKFKPKVGAWECTVCYISNGSDALYCLACETPKDDTVPKKNPLAALTTAPTGPPKFSFGVQFNPTTTGATATTTLTSTPASKAATTSVPITTSSFSFGTFTAMSTTNSPANIFGVSLSKSTASSITGSTTTSTTTTTNGGGGFEWKPPATVAAPALAIAESVKLEPKEKFSFVFTPKSPKTPINATNTEGVEDISDDEPNIEEENNTYFTPVIPLPDAVEVKTGEEDEVVLYSHRAKLFRFADSEWKERGLGDVKILKHKENKKIRVVMRREQILKICLNHALTDEIEYKPKDDKSWHFVANDFSEGEVELMQFCLRFKTSEIAKAFKQAATDAVAGKENELGDLLENDTVSEEDKQMAEKLKLPISFFGYRSAKPCSGCRGCKSDEFAFADVKSINLDFVDNNPIPLSMLVKKSQVEKTAANVALTENSFSFGTSATNTTNIFGSIKPTISGQNLFTQSVFGVGDAGKVPTNTPIKQSIFGNNSTLFSMPDNKAISESQTTTTSNTDTATVKSGFSFSLNNTTAAVDPKVTDVKSTFSFNQTLFGPTPPATTLGALTKTNGTNDSSTLPKTSFLFGTPPPAAPAQTETPKKDENSKGHVFGKSALTPAAPTTALNTSDANNSFVKSNVPDLETQKTIFGNNLAITKNVTDSSGNVFGSSIFGSKPLTTTTSSTITNFNFLNQSDTDKNNSATPTAEATAPPATVPFKEIGLSFESLAATTSSAAITEIPFSQDPTKNQAIGGFFGLSNKNDFGSFKAPTDGLNGSQTNDSATGNDGTYDPHYDPIIALPDEINVTTGEEDEEKIFGERSKLYRYDSTNKEWKERGVGELKILYHPKNGTYRLLLRREQIFKCVLNHALSRDFDISPMQNSEKAYCWATHNYADESGGALEKLSVRFKNQVIAQSFQTAVASCISQLRLEPEDD